MAVVFAHGAGSPVQGEAQIRVADAQSAMTGFRNRERLIDPVQSSTANLQLIESLTAQLAGLKAERGTALYDSLIFSFYTFNGLKGRRALLLLSDGKDEGSRFSFEEALDFARRAGVTVYAVGLGDDVDKRKLSKISEETGGRAFFPRQADELAAIYAGIQEELRSQVLIAYQSTSPRNDPGFRLVDLKVNRPGLEAKTIRGYYP